MERHSKMGEITGRQVLLFTVGAFGVIIAVNLVMAWKAISTFPGLEVKNSYVASQGFDKRKAEQQALGWTFSHDYNPTSGRLKINLVTADGQSARVQDIRVLLGRTTEAKDDQRPDLALVSDGWEAEVVLGTGKWLLKVEAIAEDGTLFEQRVDFFVRG